MVQLALNERGGAENVSQTMGQEQELRKENAARELLEEVDEEYPPLQREGGREGGRGGGRGGGEEKEDTNEEDGDEEGEEEKGMKESELKGAEGKRREEGGTKVWEVEK
ncbi:hypothetical protein CBR_g4425 [Chara braunii]|uniref:Uncharacterized protein n=1 Tax=Chara braunii TaxID=69332 RepID=A0A388KHR4_CHABU|nr:hypothetical protein CBR_g4425 [Chara braunii]|eukprot:GBG69595.1 hypothetical protein CBR_g4425 [Chara braunii]